MEFIDFIVGLIIFFKLSFFSDKKIIFKKNTKDGKKISSGKIVATVYGKAKGILKSERVALNFLSLISLVDKLFNTFSRRILLSYR